MGCPPVRGDNPRALASGLSYVQVDKHGITILYHLHQCRPSHHEMFRAKVGMGGNFFLTDKRNFFHHKLGKARLLLYYEEPFSIKYM